uniref:Putative ovule protein n=1 Tax=Solanum chacoense TaxID=4108 RepID=A0A0V0HE97_SOLCH
MKTLSTWFLRHHRLMNPRFLLIKKLSKRSIFWERVVKEDNELGGGSFSCYSYCDYYFLPSLIDTITKNCNWISNLYGFNSPAFSIIHIYI